MAAASIPHLVPRSLSAINSPIQWDNFDTEALIFRDKKKDPEWKLIEAYYTSPFRQLETILCNALEEYNRNRRKASIAEGEFRPHGKFSDDTVEKIGYWLRQGDAYLNRLYENPNMGTVEKDRLGSFIKQRMMPWMYLTHFPKRVLEKKEGFIGDHYTIEMMYMNSVDHIDHIHPLGRIIDSLFLSLSSCQAVRDRRQALAEFLVNEVNEKGNKDNPLKISSIGCGNAREIGDLFHTVASNLASVTLMDVDLRALSSARDTLNKIPGVRDQIRVKEFNAKRMNLVEELREPQDVIYSAGLLDYFDDSEFMSYFCMAYDALADGGKLVIGNYSARNPMKGTMRYLFDWNLNFRSEEHILTLAENTGKAYRSASFFHDATYKIQPFLVIQK